MLFNENENAPSIFERRLAAYEAAIDGFVPSAEQLAAVAEKVVKATNEKMFAGGATISEFDYGAHLAWHGIDVRELLEDFLPHVASCPEVVRGYYTYRARRGNSWSVIRPTTVPWWPGCSGGESQ
jgi:hypothetical protein